MVLRAAKSSFSKHCYSRDVVLRKLFNKNGTLEGIEVVNRVPYAEKAHMSTVANKVIIIPRKMLLEMRNYVVL